MTLFERSSFPIWLSFLLSGSSLPAQEIPPLDEERGLEEREVLVQTGYRIHEKNTPNVLGLQSYTLERALLDGQTVYLCRVSGHLGVPAQGRIREVGERSLWTSGLELVALSVLRADREDGKVEEFRWEDGKLMLREGRSTRGKQLACPSRPVAPESLQVCLAPPAKGEKKTVRSWDPVGRRLVESELEGDARDWKVNEAPALHYTSTLQDGVSLLTSAKDHRLLKLRYERLPIEIQQTDEPLEAQRPNVLRNETLTRALRDRIDKTWEYKGRGIANDHLGLQLRKPKEEWAVEHPKPLDAVLKVANYANHADLTIYVRPAWPGTGLDDWADALVKDRADAMDPQGKHERRSVRLGSLPAIRIEYSETSNGHRFERTHHLVLQDGLAIELVELASLTARQPQKSTLEDICKTVRFKKR